SVSHSTSCGALAGRLTRWITSTPSVRSDAVRAWPMRPDAPEMMTRFGVIFAFWSLPGSDITSPARDVRASDHEQAIRSTRLAADAHGRGEPAATVRPGSRHRRLRGDPQRRAPHVDPLHGR